MLMRWRIIIEVEMVMMCTGICAYTDIYVRWQPCTMTTIVTLVYLYRYGLQTRP